MFLSRRQYQGLAGDAGEFSILELEALSAPDNGIAGETEEPDAHRNQVAEGQ
jgi:hypothetical protein